MFKSKKFWKIVIFGALAVLLFVALPLVIPGTESTPAEFKEARNRGAEISQDIVSYYEQSAEKLKKISELDGSGRHLEGLRIVLDEMEANSEIRSKAQELAVELERMTRAASLLKSQTIRAKALEAVAVEINLVTQLITYNEYFNRLLETLRSKFAGEPRETSVDVLIFRMNDAADDINKLNERFGVLMDEFDGLF